MAIIAAVKESPKTCELIIYIADKLREKPNFGATHLGKALYLIDCTSYAKTGKPISELTYVKQEFGPTPAPHKFLPIRNELLAKKELEAVPAVYFARKFERFVAKRKPNVNVFSKEEIALINEVIDTIRPMSATELSEYTHSLLAWQAAELMEELPFHSYLLNHTEPNEKVWNWANKVIKNYEKKQPVSK